MIWFDQWKTIPVDQTRSGERVTLRVRITGLVAREVDPDSATVAESRTMGLLHRIATFQGTVDVENYVIDEVAEVNWELDEWVGVDGAVTASTVVVSSNPGASASARAAQKVQVLDVVDDSGLSVPIVQMCTASGVDYR